MRVGRWGGAPVVAMAVLASLGLRACGELSGSASTQSHLILYSGQHPQTTDKLVSAFEKQTGITVSVRSDDEDVLADQIVTEGNRSPADLFYTENSPPLEHLQDKGLLSAVRQQHAGCHPGPVQLPAGRLGRRVRPGQRARLQPPPDQPEPAAHLGHAAR